MKKIRKCLCVAAFTVKHLQNKEKRKIRTALHNVITTTTATKLICKNEAMSGKRNSHTILMCDRRLVYTANRVEARASANEIEEERDERIRNSTQVKKGTNEWSCESEREKDRGMAEKISLFRFYVNWSKCVSRRNEKNDTTHACQSRVMRMYVLEPQNDHDLTRPPNL